MNLISRTHNRVVYFLELQGISIAVIILLFNFLHCILLAVECLFYFIFVIRHLYISALPAVQFLLSEIRFQYI